MGGVGGGLVVGRREGGIDGIEFQLGGIAFLRDQPIVRTIPPALQLTKFVLDTSGRLIDQLVQGCEK